MNQQTLDQYVDALEQDHELPQPKEVWATVDGTATDALAEQLNATLGEIARAKQREGWLHFAILDSSLTTWAKVRGDPWDLHDALVDLQTLSSRLSALRFSIHFDPDGPAGNLRAGTYQGVPFAYLDKWISRFPRPQLNDLFSRCSVGCAVSPRGRQTIRESLQGVIPGLTDAGLSVSVDDRPDGIQVTAQVTTPKRADLMVPLLSRVFRSVGLLDERWRCDVAFEGEVSWRRSVSRFEQLLALETVVGAGLREQTQEPAQVEEPPPPPLNLPRLENAARVLGGEQIDFEDSHDRRVRLGADGTFGEAAGPPPRVESRDGRYAAVFVAHGPSAKFEWLDRETGATRNMALADAEYSRRPLGFVADALIIVETSLALGRIKHRFVLQPAGGRARTSRVFINASAMTLDETSSRILLTAEDDGATQLVEVALPTLGEEVLHSFARDEDTPGELLVFEGQVVGAFSSRTQTTLRRFEPQQGFRTFATLPGARDFAAKIDGPFVYVITSQLVHEGQEEWRSHLHQVSLRDGAVRTLTAASPEAETRGRVAQWVKAGEWMALVRRDPPKVELFKQAKLIDSFMPPAGQEIWSVAVSGSGALAAVTASGEASYLHLVRGETRLLFELPERLAALEWVGPNAR